jgi:hypothetical protein
MCRLSSSGRLSRQERLQQPVGFLNAIATQKRKHGNFLHFVLCFLFCVAMAFRNRTGCYAESLPYISQHPELSPSISDTRAAGRSQYFQAILFKCGPL